MYRTEIGNLKPGDIVLLPVVIRELDHYMPEIDDWAAMLTFRSASYTGTDSKLDVHDTDSVLKVDDTNPEDCMTYIHEIEARNAFLAEDAEQAADPADYAQRKQERHDRYMAIAGADDEYVCGQNHQHTNDCYPKYDNDTCPCGGGSTASCDGCGKPQHAHHDDEFGRVDLCLNDDCPN